VGLLMIVSESAIRVTMLFARYNKEKAGVPDGGAASFVSTLR
jgi:hypothetical protein